MIHEIFIEIFREPFVIVAGKKKKTAKAVYLASMEKAGPKPSTVAKLVSSSSSPAPAPAGTTESTTAAIADFMNATAGKASMNESDWRGRPKPLDVMKAAQMEAPHRTKFFVDLATKPVITDAAFRDKQTAAKTVVSTEPPLKRMKEGAANKKKQGELPFARDAGLGDKPNAANTVGSAEPPVKRRKKAAGNKQKQGALSFAQAAPAPSPAASPVTNPEKEAVGMDYVGVAQNAEVAVVHEAELAFARRNASAEVVRAGAAQQGPATPEGGNACSVDEDDAERPKTYLWPQHRADRDDVSAMDVHSPTGLKPKRKGGSDVWKIILRLRPGLRDFYTRTNFLPTHFCKECGLVLKITWSLMQQVVGMPGKVRIAEGQWQTTQANKHFNRCRETMENEALAQQAREAALLVEVKAERRLEVAASETFMTADGIIFVSEGFQATPHERAKVAIARDVLYGSCAKPDSSVECPYEREKLRLVYEAGYEEGLKGPGRGKLKLKFPFLHAESLHAHAKTEFDIMLGYMQHLSETLHQYGGGNPTMQTMSDIVTLADRMPYLSVGHNVMCPRTNMRMSINTGFAQVTLNPSCPSTRSFLCVCECTLLKRAMTW
jgi:hypothetical protein